MGLHSTMNVLPQPKSGGNPVLGERMNRGSEARWRHGVPGWTRPGVLERESFMPPLHRHEFVENCERMIAFGYSREDDEKSLIAFLQKFSDDDLMQLLGPRLSDQEIDNLVNLLMGLLKKHLNDGEYHRYFLKAR